MNAATGQIATPLQALEFDDERHEYSVCGKVVPSVTQILKSVGLIDDRWFNDHACTRGSYVAEATAYDDRGILDFASLDDEIKPYVIQWRRFLAESKAEVLEVERRVFDEAHWYAGTFDRILSMPRNSWPVLIDIKTGGPAPWHKLQTAAYAATQREYMLRGSVYLSPDSYSWSPHKELGDRNVFYAACAVHNWKESNP